MLKFDGIVVRDGATMACRIEIHDAVRADTDLYGCDVTSTFPRAIQTRVFGVDESTASRSALTFLRSLLGETKLLNKDGSPSSIFTELDPPSPSIEELGGGWSATNGVTISMGEATNNRISVQLDEVTRDRGDAKQWTVAQISTVKQLDAEEVLGMKLSQEVLADIGFNVMLRLVSKRRRH